MSIELKQAAQQALKELGEARKIIRASSSRQLAKDWDHRATAVLADLRTAIQQAEAQQPATGDPVGQVSDLFPSVRNKLHAKGFGSDAPLYTHPAPGVPAWVVSTAKEVVLNLGPQEVILRYLTESDTKRAHGVMLTAAQAQKGQQ